MATVRTERRLAAIVAADIVGYSRLMETDESGTLAAIKDLRAKVLEPLLAEHGGRIVKLMGDGAIVEFGSAIAAVTCAAALQKEVSLHQRPRDVERRIAFRVGINLGDVVVEDGDLFGDGINIAVRLESLAEAGGICISDTVQRQLAGKTDIVFKDAGEQPLKNIARPVRVWRWVDEPVTAAPAATGHGEPPPLPARPSIAVLPFDNLGSATDETYFSDGITEDIITGLARFNSLFVIARNSSFAFRGKPVDIGEIGRKLGVSYVLEGSVRRMGDRVRITAQLIEAATGAHQWADRYDRSLDDIFAVQDEVAQKIVVALHGRIQEADFERSSRVPTASLTAYDCLLRGLAQFRAYADRSNQQACDMFERAIELDPRYALAHSYLGLVRTAMHGSAGAPAAILDAAFREARYAVELDPRESRCHRVLSTICLYRREFDMAEEHARQALDLNPNDADNLMQKGRVLAMRGRAAEALACMETALRLNPMAPSWYSANFAVVYYTLGRFAESAQALKRMPIPGYWSLARVAACFAQLDRRDEAQAIVAQVLQQQPDFSVAQYLRQDVLLERQEDRELLREGLLKAGLPE